MTICDLVARLEGHDRMLQSEERVSNEGEDEFDDNEDNKDNEDEE